MLSMLRPLLRFSLILLAAATLLRAGDPALVEQPLWLRYPAVSPDGSTIAFTYGGRIWRVPATGGEATPLTDADYFATRPVWSPDGARLAYASKQFGNLDVFVMPASGGRSIRLTFHSADDLPYAFSPDGSEVYFASNRLGSPQTVLNGAYGSSEQLYAVPTIGGRNRLILPTPARAVSLDATGTRLLYEDRPVYENEWRKGAVSDGAHDVWLHDVAKKSHERLTDFRGEDRNPVWAPDGRSYYFLSEREGPSNVWRANATPGARAEQITRHREAAVRFLTVARDGTLVYGLDGEIWRRAAGAREAQRVPIRLRYATRGPERVTASANDQLTEITTSRDGRQVAVIARGEIFVLSTETGTTRRITHTPSHERNVSFAADGRSLVYISERDGDMDIFEAALGNAAMKAFTDDGPVAERKIVDTAGDVLFPQLSPDGTKLAYLADRKSIQVLDRATGTTVAALPPGYFYSYIDDDISFSWSPDSRWLTATVGSVATNLDVVLLDASGRRPPMYVAHGGFNEGNPEFGPGGKTVIWATAREADNGTEQIDLNLAYLTRAAFDQKAEPEGAAWQPQSAGIEQRTKRLTPFPLNPLFFTLLPDEEKLLVIDREAGSRAVARFFAVANGEMTEIFNRPMADGYAVDADRRHLFALTNGAIERTTLATGETTRFPLDTTMDIDARGEELAWFEHFWRTTKFKFYEPTMHGRDWDAIGAHYRRFLPHVDTWEDFAEMMSEMAGELNASHMGCSFLKQSSLSPHTASLGLYFDDSFEGPGLRVSAVLPGGPADITGSRLKPGAVVFALDTEMLDRNTDIDQLLNGMADTAVQLLVLPPGAKQKVTETVVPIPMPQAVALRRAQWVAERKALTEKLSGGRLGYVYLPAMDADTYREAYSEVIGDYRDKEGLVVDVRYNAGGNLHDQLVTLFTGEVVAAFVSRRNEIVGRMPTGRWARPTVLLQNASSYSDGSIFPHLYRRQKLGPIVGDRVPGTGTAVWWMFPMKGALKWGIPQLGARDFKTGWFENQEVPPDRLVRNDPAAIAAGRDPQLEAAVAEMLKRLPRR
jgi:tricorn protease